jgi:hypothetical protein
MNKEQLKKIIKEELSSVLVEGSQAVKDFWDLVVLIKDNEDEIADAITSLEQENPTKGRAFAKGFRALYNRLYKTMHDKRYL